MQVQRYPVLLRLFHSSMAIVIIGLLILGFVMAHVWTDEPYTRDLFTWHKSFGVVALILIGIRLPVRVWLNRAIPALSSAMHEYERIAAKFGHALLYVFMVIVPVSGYLMSSTYSNSSGIALFGLRLPDALPKNDAWAEAFTGIHVVSAYILAAFIVLHIAAVIKHRYWDAYEADILRKMF